MEILLILMGGYAVCLCLAFGLNLFRGLVPREEVKMLRERVRSLEAALQDAAGRERGLRTRVEEYLAWVRERPGE